MATYPSVHIELWTEDAIVLYDWLGSADLDAVPAEHRAVKQALLDLLARLEESVPSEHLAGERVARAQHEVSKNMGW